MASLKDLRRRIRATKSMQQIFKAMEMVAAAKLRRAQEAAEAARPYAERMERMLGSLAASMAGREGALQAPHVSMRVFARGMLIHAVTRLYFPDDEANGANAADAVLNAIDDPAGRRGPVALKPGAWNAVALTATADGVKVEVNGMRSAGIMFAIRTAGHAHSMRPSSGRRRPTVVARA